MLEIDAAFSSLPKTKPPLPKAPRADLAPVEGKEGPRSSKAGGFEGAACQMEAINTAEFSATPTIIEQKPTAEKTADKKPEKESKKKDPPKDPEKK